MAKKSPNKNRLNLTNIAKHREGVNMPSGKKVEDENTNLATSVITGSLIRLIYGQKVTASKNDVFSKAASAVNGSGDTLYSIIKGAVIGSKIGNADNIFNTINDNITSIRTDKNGSFRTNEILYNIDAKILEVITALKSASQKHVNASNTSTGTNAKSASLSIDVKNSRDLAGVMKGLFDQITDIAKKSSSSKESKDALTNISYISSFVDSIIKLGDIGYKNIVKAKRNIRYINKFVSDSVIELISNIGDNATEIQKSKNVKDIGIISDFIKLIPELGTIERQKIINAYYNAIDINDVITYSIGLLLDTINKEAKKIQSNDNIDIVNDLVDKVMEIGRMNQKEVDNMMGNYEDLIDVINDGIGSIVEGIVNLKIDKKVITNRTDAIDLIFNRLNSLNDAIIEIVSVKSTNMKIIGIIVQIKLIENLISRMSKMKPIDKNAITLFSQNSKDKKSILYLVSSIEKISEKLQKTNISALQAILGDFIKISKEMSIIGLLLAPIALSRVAIPLVVGGLKSLIIGFDSISKHIDEKKAKATKMMIRSFIELVIASTTTLLIASLVIQIIKPKDIVLFTLTLGTFMMALSGTFWLFSKASKTSLVAAEKFGILVAISGGILIAGTLFMKIIDPKDILFFGGLLLAFVTGISMIFAGFSTFGGKAIRGAKDFGILIAISAGTLLIGGLLMKIIDTKDIILFGALLLGFVTSISLIFVGFSIFGGKAIRGAEKFGVLVAISGAVLLIGGLMFKAFPDLYKYVGLFALELGLFVMAITYIYNKSAKKIYKAIPTASALGVLVAISSAALLIGGMMFLKNEGLVGSVALFGTVLVSFIGVMSTVAYFLGKFKKQILGGELVMAGVCVITFLMSVAIRHMANTMLLLNKIKWEDIGKATAIIGGIVTMCGVIGIPVVAGAVALGATVMGGISLVAMLMSTALIRIATAVKVMKSIGTLDTNATKLITEGITNFKTIIKILTDSISLKDTPKLIIVGKVMQSVGEMLSKISRGIQDYASLQVPIGYDKDGRPTGYRSLQNSDFTNAANNIQTIVTTIGDAIIDSYNKNPQMFGMSLANFLTGDNPFTRVVKSCTSMGNMISMLAYAIKDYSTLKVPVEWDKSGKATAWRHLTDKDFNSASHNISKIITILGSTISNIYKNHGEYFDKNFWQGGSSPVDRVVSSMTKASMMLSLVGMTVKSWSSMTVPIYDEKGKRTGVQKLTNADLIMAGISIGSVISTIGNALVGVLENDKKSGTNAFDFSIAGSPILVLSKAISYISKTLSTIASCVGYYADGRFPMLQFKDGKLNTVISGQFTKEKREQAKTNIVSVISMIGEALTTAIESDTTGLYKDISKAGIVQNVAKSISIVSNTLSTIIDTLTKFIQNDKNSKSLVNDLGTMKTNMISIMGAVTSLVNLFGIPGDGDPDTGTTGFWFWKKKKTIGKWLVDTSKDIEEAKDSTKSLVDTLTEYIKSIVILQKSYNDNKDELLKFISKNKNGEIIIVSVFKHSINSIASLLDVFNKKYQYNNREYKLKAILRDYSSEGAELNKNLISSIKLSMTFIRSIARFSDLIQNDMRSIIAFNSSKSVLSISRSVKGVSSILTTLSQSSKNINTKLASLESLNYSPIKRVVKGFNASISELYNIGNVDPGNNISNIQDKLSEIIAINSAVRMFDNNLRRIISTSTMAMDAGTEGFETIAKGLNIISDAEKNLGENGIFRQHTDIMERYVKSINSVKLRNMSSLNRFANSMNLLASRLGNIDKLTNTLATSIATVLQKLTNELRRAEKTIKNADELQKRRHKLIDDSIKNVKTIMNQHLIVDVQQIANMPTEDNSNMTLGDAGVNTSGTGISSDTTIGDINSGLTDSSGNLNKNVAKFDVNGDGKISSDEMTDQFMQVLAKLNKIEKIVKK